MLLSDRGFSLHKEHKMNYNKTKHERTFLQIYTASCNLGYFARFSSKLWFRQQILIKHQSLNFENVRRVRVAVLNAERQTDRQTWRHWLSPFATAWTESACQPTVWTRLTNSLYRTDSAVFIHKYYSRVIYMYYIYAIIHYKYKPLRWIFVLSLCPAFVMIRGIGYWTLEWESNG